MAFSQVFTVILSLFSIALAWGPPTYPSYNVVWASEFNGVANTLPPTSEWNLIQNSKTFNNEIQVYKKSTNNLKVSGKGTIQIIPRKDSTGVWTSGRIESNYKFTPTPGKITILQSRLRLAGNPAKNKQGIWPAFWILGNSYRHGGTWPATGEIDIMENINGQSVASGALHCDTAPGGICNEPSGLTGSVIQNDNLFHSWRVQFDRRSDSWKEQSITWMRDGVQYNKITGARINNATVWATVCQSPLYVILNVAVGGDWPGAPNASTWGGSGSMMEVAYVAHYVSK